MTPSKQLQAIIEAQVQGGNEKWKPWIGAGVREGVIQDDGYPHILEILPNPAGLKAAYGREDDFWRDVAHNILADWLSSDGDAVKTIDTAYNLLPSSL